MSDATCRAYAFARRNGFAGILCFYLGAAPLCEPAVFGVYWNYAAVDHKGYCLLGFSPAGRERRVVGGGKLSHIDVDAIVAVLFCVVFS